MNALETPPKNIVLIGFMGCGKTTVGRELHQLLGYPLVDMDAEIEKRAGKTISQIFEEEGEPSFRDREAALLQELLASPQSLRIISTGGGVIVRERNRSLLRQLGYVVWLHAPAEVIFERTAKSAVRPLLQGDDAMKNVRELLQVRKPWYAETAHLKVETAGLDCREVATGILESARYFFTSRV